MLTLRPYLTALLGLMLWVQGFAIAAAPVAPADAAGGAMEMHCHGEAATSACDCCQGDCPDMAGCVIGHFAGAPAAPLHLAPAAQAAVTARGWSLKTAVPPFPLRPPIFSHA